MIAFSRSAAYTTCLCIARILIIKESFSVLYEYESELHLNSQTQRIVSSITARLGSGKFPKVKILAQTLSNCDKAISY